MYRYTWIVFSFWALNACAFESTVFKRDLSGANLQTATINLYSRCEQDFASQMLEVRPLASIRIPWSGGNQVEFEYAKFPKALLHEDRSWHWNGTIIFVGNEGYPADLIRQGLISFDGQKVVINQSFPSMIREKIAIGIPRKADLGQLSFPNCQDFLLKTDFGKRRTIECEGIGLIAEDHYSRINLAFYPAVRLVATHKTAWNHPVFANITRRPPYHEELVIKVEQLANGLDFLDPCRINFLEIFRVDE